MLPDDDVGEDDKEKGGYGEEEDKQGHHEKA